MIEFSVARRVFGGIAIVVLAAGLAGCEQTASLQPAADARIQRIAARPGVSPAAAPVSLVSIEGAPASVVQTISQQMLGATAAREVILTDAGQAKYLAKLYLAAYPVEGGAAITFVWDVFDGQKRRQQRIEDALVLKGSSADPWGLVDQAAATQIAARSAEDLAAWLTHTPEAIAGSAVARSTPTAPFPTSVPVPGRALGYAPAN
jgi:hypothetical protein